MEKARRVPVRRAIATSVDERDQGRAEMRAGIVLERCDQRVRCEDLLHARALHTDAATVHEPHGAQAKRMRFAQVRVDHVRDVAWREGMEIELGTDRDVVSIVHRHAARVDADYLS